MNDNGPGDMSVLPEHCISQDAKQTANIIVTMVLGNDLSKADMWDQRDEYKVWIASLIQKVVNRAKSR